MKITACLCWYDEKVEMLERSIASLVGVVDELVAFDGRWELFPAPERGRGDVVHSKLHQQYAVVEAAHNAGLPLVRETARQEPWPSQVAKRSAMTQSAIAGGADWLLVIDADEWIEAAATRGLRQALARTGADVASVDYKIYSGERCGARYPIRRLYRAASGVHIETAHNGYRAGDGRWLHGDTSYVTLDRSEDVTQFIILGEDHDVRSLPRQMAKREYRRARGRERIEAWT